MRNRFPWFDPEPTRHLQVKSHQEALDDWALAELVGHYVNYRKQCSPSLDDLLPEHDFRLFAVCARFPPNLAGQVALAPVGPGVYAAHGAVCRRSSPGAAAGDP